MTGSPSTCAASARPARTQDEIGQAASPSAARAAAACAHTLLRHQAGVALQRHVLGRAPALRTRASRGPQGTPRHALQPRAPSGSAAPHAPAPQDVGGGADTLGCLLRTGEVAQRDGPDRASPRLGLDGCFPRAKRVGPGNACAHLHTVGPALGPAQNRSGSVACCPLRAGDVAKAGGQSWGPPHLSCCWICSTVRASSSAASSGVTGKLHAWGPRTLYRNLQAKQCAGARCFCRPPGRRLHSGAPQKRLNHLSTARAATSSSA